MLNTSGKQRLKDKPTVAKAIAIANSVREMWRIKSVVDADGLISRSPHARAIVLAAIIGNREHGKLRMLDPTTGLEVILPRD